MIGAEKPPTIPVARARKATTVTADADIFKETLAKLMTGKR